ncbi:MAG TPA: YciI family protein [Rhodocyclaceae bacterium]|jgi:hypothetical protein|nr:YciI family protein [Rhodocyclaceae bacterium]HRQ45998.1 YciI family protein [Rhodocyclaceae bacterium]
MRFLIIVKATAESEAGALPDEGLIASMAAYHEELACAGALLDAAGLRPSAAGWRVRHDGNRRTVIQGPFDGHEDLIAGYTLIQARSREEALEWARRFPNPRGEGLSAEIEVRQLHEPDEIPP